MTVCRVHDADDLVAGRICGRPLPCRDHKPAGQPASQPAQEATMNQLDIPFCGPLNSTQYARSQRCKGEAAVEQYIRRHYAKELPLIVVGPFSTGIVALYPRDPHALSVLKKMCPPGPAHTWTVDKHGRGLLVEQRYANDLVEALRERGVFIP